MQNKKIANIQGNHVEITLSPAQINNVTALKESIEGGHLLGYLQEFPGGGKTTTAKKMDVMYWAMGLVLWIYWYYLCTF